MIPGYTFSKAAGKVAIGKGIGSGLRRGARWLGRKVFDWDIKPAKIVHRPPAVPPVPPKVTPAKIVHRPPAGPPVHPKVTPADVYRKSGQLSTKYTDAKKLPRQAPTIKGVYGDKIPDTNLDYTTTVYGIPLTRRTITGNEVNTALNIFDRPGFTHDALYIPVSDKGNQRAEALYGFFDKLYGNGNGNMWGTVRPIDVANTSAGDNRYGLKAYKAMIEYLDNPSSGWKLDDRLSKTRGNPTYMHTESGQIFTPNLLWRDANARTPFTKLPIPYNSDNYWQNSLTKVVNIPDVRSSLEMRDPGITLRHADIDELSNYNHFFRGGTSMPRLIRSLYGLHELNHSTSSRAAYNGLFPGGGFSRTPYRIDPAEAAQAASSFKQQYYRNTGKLIKTEADAIEAIRQASNNTKDYDSEARRFLAQMYENQAESRSEYSEYGRDGLQELKSAHYINNVIRALPLLLSAPVSVGPTLMNQQSSQESKK